MDSRRVSSFGSLRHFTADNAPAGAPERCLDGCPHSETCPYYAPKIYLTGKTDWPVDVLEDGWTTVSRDGSLTSHYENSILITSTGYEVLTML